MVYLRHLGARVSRLVTRSQNLWRLEQGAPRIPGYNGETARLCLVQPVEDGMHVRLPVDA